VEAEGVQEQLRKVEELMGQIREAYSKGGAEALQAEGAFGFFWWV
jgi:hypothetical protein